MGFLITAVVLLTGLGIVNLLLLLAVIRRLREHAERLDASSTAPAELLAPGAAVPPVTAITTDGRPLTDADLRGTLVGFFSPTCRHCRTQRPLFIERADAEPAIAVVVDDGTADVAGDVDALTPVARVVVCGPDDPLPRAFSVHAYPALFLVGDDGAIRWSDVDLTSMPRSAIPA